MVSFFQPTLKAILDVIQGQRDRTDSALSVGGPYGFIIKSLRLAWTDGVACRRVRSKPLAILIAQGEAQRKRHRSLPARFPYVRRPWPALRTNARTPQARTELACRRNKAVAYGAVSFYLDHFVSSRVTKVTYGTEIYVDYNPDDPEHFARRYQKFTPPSGRVSVPNRFSIVLQKVCPSRFASTMNAKLTYHLGHPCPREGRNITIVLPRGTGFPYPEQH